MVVLRRAMLGAGTHRDPVLSILSGDDHPEVQLICARPITSSLEPGVRILHRPCRPLLRGLEQAHRAALDDHVHRPTRLGQWVLISGSWYEPASAVASMACLPAANAPERTWVGLRTRNIETDFPWRGDTPRAA